MLNDLQKSAKKLNIKIPTNTYNKDDRLKEYYMQSISLLSLGEHSKALEKINEDLIIDNTESSLLSLKGRILLEMGNLNEALKYTLLSNDFNPYNSKTLNNIGIIYGRLGKIDYAIKYLEESVKVDPQNSGALMNLAIQFENNGNVGHACSCILKALNIAPDKKDLLFNASNIAALAAKNGEFNKSIQILEILIKTDKQNNNNWFNLALYYTHMNQKENAVNCFLHLVKVLPTDEEVLTFLTRLLGELGRYDEALVYCEKMLENNIAILKAISFKAQLLQSLGRTKEAIQFIKAVLANNSENENLWMLLSDLYGNEKDFKNGLFYADRARKVILLQGKKINNDNLSYIDQKISFYKRYGIN